MTWRTRPPSRRAVLGAAAACVLAWALPAALLDGVAREVAATSALTAGALAAGVLCALRAAASSGRRRAAWALFAASSAAWAAGEVVWAVHGLRAGTAVVPAEADPLFLASAALVVLGVVLLTLKSSVLAGRVLVALDGAIIAAAALAATWQWLVVPFTTAGPADFGPFPSFTSAAYVVLDVAAIATGVLVLARAGRRGLSSWWRGPLPLLAAAAVCIGLGDYLTGQAALAGTYGFGHPAEATYAVRSALVVAAALVAGDREDPATPLPGRVVLLAPFAVALAGVGAVVHRAAVGSVDGATLVIVGVLALLVVARQVLTVLEHTALRRDLEVRVAERTGELARQERWFRTVLMHSSDVVTAVDAAGVVTWQSEGPHRRRFATAVGRPLLAALPEGETAARAASALRQAVATPGSVQVLDWSLPLPEGERHLETVATSLLHDPAVAAVVLTTRDVTERTHLQRQLSHQAFHDELTGLANRNLFRDRLEHALSARVRDGHPLAVLFLDLDGFKSVNDTLGHATGDLLLREVATRLAGVVRPGDTVARLGGDEFAVLLERVTGVEEAEQVARRVLEGLTAPVVVDGRRLPVTGSLGLAVTETGEETGEELLRNADLAMYSAKAARSEEPARYHPRMHEQLVARVRTEEGLRVALADGQLRVHYQPTVALDTGRVTGVEALVRWQHPDGHLVPPLEFIPVAEESGLIIAIGEWVLREACAQGALWARRAEEPLSVSVNVSGRQLVPGLADTVARVLAETGFPAELLVLELTESVLVADGEGTVALLDELKALGVRLAIDDFGTGYSSLAYLSRLPVDVIKVDRSFVSDLGAAGERADLARTIIEMARTLQLSTTAEGIESGEQLQVLRTLGCDLGQGFLFSRPVPAEDVGALLDRGLTTTRAAAPPRPRTAGTTGR